MKFIVPQNYNFKSKILGFLDYTTAFVNVIWCFIVFLVLNLFEFALINKLSIFIILCFPLFLISLFGFQNENIVFIFIYIFKFIKNRKIYFFYK